MRFLTLVFLLGLSAAVVSLWFFREQITVQPFTVLEFPTETPIKRLSAFMDAHHSAVFSPLKENDTPVSTQDLKKIHATLRDLASSTQNEGEKKLYLAGAQVCSLMLQAINERENHVLRLRDSKAHGYRSTLSRVADRRAEEAKRKEFFEGAIHRSWENTASRIRNEVQRQYDSMLRLER